MGKVIGIDLGTTNSCVAVMEGNDAVVITNSEGKRTTPSIVALLEDGERKIGEAAKRQAVTNPERTISSIKRFIGKKFEKIGDEMKYVSYNVIDEGGFPKVKIGDKTYTPQEISAMVIQKMKQTAEDYLGQEVTEAVITVPAYFNDAERKATKEAGEIAGLKVQRIINEPTAASLAYGLDKQGDRKICVFDCGGGTHDISILDLGDGVFEVIATDGDTHLGGDDFDNAIIDWIIDEFEKENKGVDLRKDKMAFQRVKEAAEKAKIELSSTMSTDINLPYICQTTGKDQKPLHLVTSLTRAKFEALVETLIDRTLNPCKLALKSAGMNVNDIDEVILVGGTTRIPAIQEAVKDFFGKEPSKGVNPDEVVALGAAIQGGVLTGEVNDVLLLDVIPLSLGIETMGGVFTKLIESNTTIPTSKSETFSTAADNQTSVQINVLQGERSMASDNKLLGRFHLEDLPPAARGVPQIEVTFDVDADGILSVKAKDKATGKETSIRIEASSGLSDEEIERMRQEAEANEEADKKKKEEIDKINSADSYYFSVDKSMKEFADKISDDEKQSINEKLAALRSAVDTKEVDKIDDCMNAVKEAFDPIIQKAYQEGASNESSTETAGDSATDVDFEEVD
jgi:molecular chaperone DnaK